MLRGVPVTYSASELLTPHAGRDRCAYPTELAGWHFWQDLARAARRRSTQRAERCVDRDGVVMGSEQAK